MEPQNECKNSWVKIDDLKERIDAQFYQEEYIIAEKKILNLPTKSFSKLWKESNRIYIGIAGFKETSSDYEYTPYIRPTDVGPNGEIEWADIAWCYSSWLDDHKTKGCAKEGDLLVEVKENTKRVALVNSNVHKNCIVSGSFWRIQLTPEVSKKYIFTFLISDTSQLLKRRWISNSVIPWIDPGSFKNFLIPLPDIKVQEYIGKKIILAEKCRDKSAIIQDELDSLLTELYQKIPSIDASDKQTTVKIEEFDDDRMDAWHYQRNHIDLYQWLKGEAEFDQVSKIASLSKDRWNPKKETNFEFTYIEISNVDTSTSALSPNIVKVCDAPSRARKLLRSYDILISTVRPNRGGISVIPKELSGAVASTGFAVLRTNNKEDAYFLCQILKHPVSITQLMRWNTGSTYPAIEEDVVLKIWVPGANENLRKKIGKLEMKRYWLQEKSSKLVNGAKSDVETLIECKLDTDAIQSGKLKAPTWEDIEKELEGI
jgi:type I restriction enzyme, S subunit